MRWTGAPVTKPASTAITADPAMGFGSAMFSMLSADAPSCQTAAFMMLSRHLSHQSSNHLERVIPSSQRDDLRRLQSGAGGLGGSERLAKRVDPVHTGLIVAQEALKMICRTTA